MSLVRLNLAIILVLAAATQSFADTVRVIIDRALVWNRPSGVAVIITQLNRGTVVDVVRRDGDWYEIVVPGRQPSTGFIRATQVVLETIGPPSAQAARATAAARPTTTRRRRPGFFNFDAAYRVAQDDLTRSFSDFSHEYAEAGDVSANYGKTIGLAADITVGQALVGQVGLGFGASYYLRQKPADVTAHVPHPFHFDSDRTATFTSKKLNAHETAIHIPVVWIPPPFGRFKVLVFGGPSLFRVAQTVVTGLTLDDQYPFDTVAITGVVTEERRSLSLGYHAGADLGIFFGRTRNVGVGVGARFTRADLKFEDDGATSSAGFAGALQAVAGLRYRF